MSEKNNFSLKHLPFSSFNLADGKKLPYIPTLINKDKIKVKTDLLLLGEKKLPLIPKLEIEKSHLNKLSKKISLRKRITTDVSIDNNNNSRILNHSISRNRYSARLEKLRKMNENKSIDNSSPSLGIFLTNMNKKKENNTINRNIISYVNKSHPLSSRHSKRKSISLQENYNLLYSLEYLNLLSNNKYNSLQNNIDSIDGYERKMIDKCHNTLKYYDDKYMIQSDEYLKDSNFNDDSDMNLKINQFLDSLISKNKDFDYITMMNLLKEREKKQIMKKINQMKIEKKHEKFLKLINDGQVEAKKAEELYEEVRKKHIKQLSPIKNTSKQKMHIKKNDNPEEHQYII